MRILVVDDHRNTRDALALGLLQLGAHAQTAASAEEALECLRAGLPDWLVSDVRMPGMSGIELASRVRESGGAIGVILMTAYDVTAEERRRISELGAELWIKPVIADALAARLTVGSSEHQPLPRL